MVDIYTSIMLENWGFLAEVGDWETLEKAVNIYLEQNPPLVYPTESNADSFGQTPARLSEPHPRVHQNTRSTIHYG